MSLNSQQAEAFNLLETFATSTANIFRLSGYSGTGKSFLSCQFLGWLKDSLPDALIVAIAPSNKAKQNLKLMLADAGIKCDVQTISSFLGLRPVLDQASGKESFKESDKPSNIGMQPEDYDFVLCDEYSMIPKEQVLALNQKCQKLIYLGDPAQLEPVGEDVSWVTKLDCPGYQLTEVVRYSGDLARVAESWRDAVAIKCNGKIERVIKIPDSPKLSDGFNASFVNITKPIPIDETSDGSIVRLHKIEWVEQFAIAAKKAIHDRDTYACRIICYTNKTCDKWNDWVRSEMWEGDERQYIIGDRLLCKKPLFREDKFTGKDVIVVANSTEFSVIENFQIQQITIQEVIYNYLEVPAEDDEGLRINLRILTPDCLKLQIQELKKLADTAKTKTGKERSYLWFKFYQLQKYFDDVSYGYAVSTHRSQGSTYGASYLDLADLYRCSSLKKIIYTALTRSKQAYIFR
jgi:AAA domain